MLPRVLTIGGTDSSGAAGLQQDQRALQCFAVHQISVVSLVSAQTHDSVLHVSPVSPASFSAQLQVAFQPQIPAVIKVGALANDEQIHVLIKKLSEYPQIPVIWDPVLQTSSKSKLGDLSFDAIAGLLPYITLITPNYDELAWLTGFTLRQARDELAAAHQLIASGCDQVLVKGGHRPDSSLRPDSGNTSEICDVLYSKENVRRFVHKARQPFNLRGSGCLLASAIAGAMAEQYITEDAVSLAEAVVAAAWQQAELVLPETAVLRRPPSEREGHAEQQTPLLPASLLPHFPAVFEGLLPVENDYFLPELLDSAPGLYPVVDSIKWLQRLLPLNLKIIQLRIKSKGAELSEIIREAVTMAAGYNTQLFINDHWQLAIEHGAYGVHLGQEDLASADLSAIARAGLRLGISTHGYAELCRAIQIRPSYIALGHIFPTRTKDMPSAPQGPARLADYVSLCKYHGIPTVAIGGIKLSNIDTVAATGTDAIAVVRAITESDNPEDAVNALRGRCRRADH